MKLIYTLFFAMFAMATQITAQTVEELEAKKAEIEASKSTLQGQVDSYNAYQAEIDGINGQLSKMQGWQKGLSGLVGFGFNKSNNWIGSPNPNASSSSLNLSFTGFANKITEDNFWRNKGILSKSWSDVDLNEGEDDGLFDNGTADILNLSSLYGRRLNDKFAISAMGEVNTSLENFFSPGTLDIGAGATWTPTSDLVVVIHPLNYHFAFSGDGGPESVGALGAKVRADYTHTFPGGVALSSTLTTFLPYSNNDPDPSLFEYSWINTLSFEVWKGVGVGLSFGLRKADFEILDTSQDTSQTYYSIGISYAL